MKYDICALGEILIDFTPAGADSAGDSIFARKAGGAPLNLLATASKYGLKTAYIGKVGDDIFGKFLKKTVRENGIDSFIKTDKTHNTTLAFVELNDKGDRDFSFYRNYGADTCLEISDVNAEAIRNSHIFHFGSLSLTQEPSKGATEFALHTAKEAGCLITYDPNYRAPLWSSEEAAVRTMAEYLRYADVVKVSKEEAFMLANTRDEHTALDFISAQGAQVILMTDGDGDVWYSINGQVGTVAAKKVDAVDTTGAGDIFFGTFLTCFVKSGLSLEELTVKTGKGFIEKAVEQSALSTLKRGAIASIPDMQ